MLKPSHYTTPRTMQECTFFASGDPWCELTGSPKWYWNFKKWFSK